MHACGKSAAISMKRPIRGFATPPWLAIGSQAQAQPKINPTEADAPTAS